MSNKYILWLDDIRDPKGSPWDTLLYSFKGIIGISDVRWVKSYNEFVSCVKSEGIPALTCFDNDLGEEKEGYDCAKWLVDYCLDNNIRNRIVYYIQSDNGPARENIKCLMDNFNRYQLSYLR